MFNINREKEKKRELMQRELRKEHPGCNKLELKKIWRKQKKEKELEAWCKQLLHDKFSDGANQRVFLAIHDWKKPNINDMMQDVSEYISDCLEKRELYYLKKGRESQPVPMKQKLFENLRIEATSLRLGGLERIGIYVRRKHRIMIISDTLQGVIDRSCVRHFYRNNRELNAGQTYLDEHGRLHIVSQEVRELIQKEGYLQQVMERIRKQYHFIYNMSIMIANVRYPFIREIYQDELKKDKLVMTAIPDNIIDTYPYARNIRRHFVLHIGGPNTGKTFEALRELSEADSGIYLAPLRLLAFEIQEKLKENGVHCSLRTGEEEDIDDRATHESCTVEKLLCDTFYDVGVIDEAQMIADDFRGWAWTQAILGLYARRIHVCMSEDAEWIVTHLIKLCGDTYEVIYHERNTELIFEKEAFRYPKDVQEHDALVVFSREKVIQTATELERLGIRTSMIYGALPSNVRKGEMERFLKGDTQVVVSTDAIGMGLNLPIRRIVFLEPFKFDGVRKRLLNATEVKQIAGRAGRRGIFDVGYVASTDYQGRLAQCLQAPLRTIRKAKIGFPQTLLSLDMGITDIMTRWMKVPDDGNLEKASMDKEIQLCSYMEQRYHFEKDIMMGFATIPFDLQRITIYEYWCYLIQCYAQDNGDILIPEPESAESLEDMETLYKKYDLLYSFSKVIRNDYLQKIVMQYKNVLAERIRKTVADKGSELCNQVDDSASSGL